MLDVCRWLFHDNWEVVAGHTRRARRRCTQVVGRDHVQECPRCSLVTSLRVLNRVLAYAGASFVLAGVSLALWGVHIGTVEVTWRRASSGV